MHVDGGEREGEGAMEGRPAATASYSGRRPGRAGHRKWGGGGGHDCAARQEDEHAVRRVQGGREPGNVRPKPETTWPPLPPPLRP